MAKTSYFAAPKAKPELRQGMFVDYHPRTGPKETGRVVRWNDQWVYVRFGDAESTPKACFYSSLTQRGGTKRLG